MIRLFMACILSLWALAAGAQEELTAERLIDQVDKLYRSESSYAELEMRIVTSNWERRLALRMWTRGMDHTFIYITAPKKDVGMATLRTGKEMWNYFPKIDKVMKVPPSMMMSAWMGSDFTNDDLVKESSLLEDYHARLVQPEDAEPGFYYVELVPREQTATVWGRIEIAVQQEDLLPVRQVYYDEKGRQMRRLDLKEVRQLGGRKIPVVLELTPLGKEGHKTVIRYLDARFDEEVEDRVFTLRNLRKKR